MAEHPEVCAVLCWERDLLLVVNICASVVVVVVGGGVFATLKDCLDLIEGKQKGLLTMLDDECRMGIRGTDANYASRLYKEHLDTPRFEADNALMTKLCFAVKHYAGQVGLIGLLAF